MIRSSLSPLKKQLERVSHSQYSNERLRLTFFLPFSEALPSVFYQALMVEIFIKIRQKRDYH